MNNVSLIGRLTKDPEVSYTQGENSTCVGRYTLAVDRQFKKEGQQDADFIRCVCFGKTGEFAEKYLRKGLKVAVVGRIQTGSYKNQNGDTVYSTDVVVNNHYFCESKNSSSNNAHTQAGSDGFMDVPEDMPEGLPFN